jgi:hypothetical protein
MLATVNLDYEPRPQANQVDDVGTDRKLAAESIAIDLLASQSHPELELGVGHFTPQSAGSSNVAVRGRVPLR